MKVSTEENLFFANFDRPHFLSEHIKTRCNNAGQGFHAFTKISHTEQPKQFISEFISCHISTAFFNLDVFLRSGDAGGHA